MGWLIQIAFTAEDELRLKDMMKLDGKGQATMPGPFLFPSNFVGILEFVFSASWRTQS